MTHTLDGISYGIVFATVFNILPPLAALISILWIAFQFYYSEPVREWRQKRKDRKSCGQPPSSN